MATTLFRTRNDTMKAVAVSSRELLAFRSGLMNDVIPYVPTARERFEKHFFDSFMLISSLRGDIKGDIPVGFTLTLIGVKSFFVAKPPFSGALMRQLDALSSLGMGFRPRIDMQMEVYNPGELAPALSTLTGQPTRSETEIHSALAAFVILNRRDPGKYPYDLLGWSAAAVAGNSYPMCTLTTNGHTLDFPLFSGSTAKGILGAHAVATYIGSSASRSSAVDMADMVA